MRGTAIGEPTNGAASVIEDGLPFICEVTIVGTSDLLFHAWNCDAVKAKGEAAKGSKAKKSDDIETYVYRDDKGILCLPGEYLRMSLINAAKRKQDPSSPRKSACDLYKAGVISLTYLASLGVKTWDYEHRARVTIQRAGITRTRPAIKAGWEAMFQLQVNTPEYIKPDDLCEVITNAGRLVGVGDFRPTFGRFRIGNFKLMKM